MFFCLRLACLLCLTLLLALPPASPAMAQTQQKPLRPGTPPEILVLVSSAYGYPSVELYVSGLVRTLREQGVPLLNIHVEYLDLIRHPDPAYRRQMAQLMLQKYAGMRIQSLLALQQPALGLVLNEARTLAPGATVLAAFAQVPPELENDARNFIFQMPRYDFAGTLQRALELYPNTRHVIVAAGDSEVEAVREKDIEHQLAPWRGRLTLHTTGQTPFAVLLNELSHAAPDTVVITTGYLHDVSGRLFVAADTINQMAALASAPVFTLIDASVRGRALGGMMPRLADSAAVMAKTALGPPPREHLSTMPMEILPVFNWPELERRKLDPSVLPPQTQFLFRPPTLWQQHQGFVLGISALILLLVLALAALLWQLRRRQRAETALQRREAYYRRQIEQAPEAILVLDFDQRRILDANPAAQRLFCATRAELLASWLPRWYDEVQPDGRPATDTMWEHLERALAGEHEVFERSVRTATGEVVPCEVRVVSMDEPGRRVVRSSFIRLQERPVPAAQRRA